MKIILFGTGDYYRRYRKWFMDEEILALLDNSLGKQNTFIDKIKVLPPEEGVKLPYDAIVILSFYVKEMREQLLQLGVPENRIYHFYELYRLIDVNNRHQSVCWFGAVEDNIKTREKNVLLLSHDLTFGGPALALLHMAIVLKENGYLVSVGSMLDGPLRHVLLDNDISVVIDENMQIGTMKNCEWVKQFSLIVCNTINFYVFLSERFTEIPVIWWLHDSQFFYDGVNKQLLQKIDRTNLKVLSVGPVPRNAIQKFIPDLRVDELLYGVPDEQMGNSLPECKLTDKINFVTIGYIENRKGQDLLVKAIETIPETLRKNAVFYFVGQDTSEMAQYLVAQAEKIPQIQITGPVNRDTINSFLHHADMMICPSREDPMPTVTVEAMMQGLPCLVSDVTGTAAYLKDGINGIVFQSENVKELAWKIMFCIENREYLAAMGKKARNVYESDFSMKIFKKNLMRIIEKY